MEGVLVGLSTGRVIARATFVILLMGVLSKILGLGREMAIAHQFGATGATDAYLVAYTIPTLFMGVVGGAMAVMVVPVFAEYAARGERDEAWRLFSSVLNFMALVLAGLVALGIAAAPFIVRVLAPGFSGGVEAVAVRLVMIMLPSMLFLVLGNLTMGLLNANNVFGPPAFGPAAMNGGIILAALVLGRFYGIDGLAAGTVGGAALFILVQAPFLWRAGFRWQPVMNLRHPGAYKLMSLIMPVMVMTGVAQGYMLIERVLASGLPEGSIAALNYAQKLILLPQGLFVMAMSTAIFPTLSRQVAEGKVAEMAGTLMRGVKLVFFVAVPAGVFLMVLRLPVITLLFQRGAFDERAVSMTALALLFYSVGLAGQAVNPLLVRGFYALQDTGTPLKVTVATVLLNLLGALLLIASMRHAGLALANSVATLGGMAALIWLLGRRLPLAVSPFLRFCGGVIAASGLMAVLVYTGDTLLAKALGEGTPALALRVMLDLLTGGAVYLAASFVLQVDELRYLWDTGKGWLKSLPLIVIIRK